MGIEPLLFGVSKTERENGVKFFDLYYWFDLTNKL